MRSHRPQRRVQPAGQTLAPRWHTAALITLMLAVAATGLALGRDGVPRAARSSGVLVGVYVPLLVVEWTLAFYVCRIGRPKSALLPLLGRGWDTLRRAATDVALAAAGWVVVEATEAAFVRFAASPNAAVFALLPHTLTERLVWLLLATSVGFCEEVVYRGYLQTQLTAFTGHVSIAIGLQAALFGLAHGEQGLAVSVRFALYGIGFGVLAQWRRSLIAGILCHIAIDLGSGFLHR